MFCVAAFSTAISGLPELLKVDDTMAIGPFSVAGSANGDFGNGVNPPSASPAKTEIVFSPSFATAKSRFPSPLKSPITTARGFVPTVNGEPTASVNVPSKLWLPSNTLTVFDPLFAITRSAGCARCVASVARKIADAIADGNCSFVPSWIGDPVGTVKFPLSLLSKMETELLPLFTTARSGLASLLRSCATTATGFCPTAKFVCANVVDVTAPPTVVPPRLVESRDKVTGYRCPTKNVAGLPSCARIKISRPLLTSDNPSENFAEAFGMVSKNVLFPPPTGNTSVGLAVIPRAVKICDINVSRLVKSVAASSFARSLEFSGNACTFEGGVIPKARALFRSTSSSSISSMTSRRLFQFLNQLSRQLHFVSRFAQRQAVVLRVHADACRIRDFANHAQKLSHVFRRD